jgi:hypothetical protein
MGIVKVQDLTNIGNIADGDKLVGERVSGTTGVLTFNGVLYDTDFASDGIMTRTASGVYANRTLTGTTNMVDISNGDGISGNPTFTIASTYAGGTSIASVGTVTVGTWSADAIALNKITALTASRAVASDASGFLVSATTTATELGYVNGVTSAIQTQLNTKITISSTDTLTNKSIDADTNTITNIENADIKAAAAIAVDKLAAVTASRALVSDGSGFVSPATTTSTEIGYVNGVTSAIQTQLNTKAPTASPTFTGTVTIPTPFTIGAVSVTATGTELNYVDGVTSAIQTQLNLKAPSISPSFTTPALGTPSSGVLTNCTGLPPAGLTGMKAVIQRVYTQTGAVATGTTILPIDDTIPQNTEGVEFMTLAITPTNASNILEIRAIASISSSASGATAAGAALFQDTTVGALAAVSTTLAGQYYVNPCVICHTMVAGTTSSTTFKIRAGDSAAGTTTFNGQIGARLLGGVYDSFIVITEYKV